MTEEYTGEELTFFLYVRSLMEKELNYLFISNHLSLMRLTWRLETRDDFPIGVSYRVTLHVCQKVAESAFGRKEKQFIASIIKKTREFIHQVSRSSLL